MKKASDILREAAKDLIAYAAMYDATDELGCIAKTPMPSFGRKIGASSNLANDEKIVTKENQKKLWDNSIKFPACYKSNPAPSQRTINKCYDCDHVKECLKGE